VGASTKPRTHACRSTQVLGMRSLLHFQAHFQLPSPIRLPTRVPRSVFPRRVRWDDSGGANARACDQGNEGVQPPHRCTLDLQIPRSSTFLSTPKHKPS
jgi:hypothetical protein